MLAEFMRRTAMVVREAAAGVAIVLRVSRMAGCKRRILGEGSGADESSGIRPAPRPSEVVATCGPPIAWLLEGLCKFAKLRLNGA
jgi:hypothetical protein